MIASPSDWLGFKILAPFSGARLNHFPRLSWQPRRQMHVQMHVS